MMLEFEGQRKEKEGELDAEERENWPQLYRDTWMECRAMTKLQSNKISLSNKLKVRDKLKRFKLVFVMPFCQACEACSVFLQDGH